MASVAMGNGIYGDDSGASFPIADEDLPPPNLGTIPTKKGGYARTSAENLKLPDLGKAEEIIVRLKILVDE